jgi:hypothetical protein
MDIQQFRPKFYKLKKYIFGNTGCANKTRKFHQFPKPDICRLVYFKEMFYIQKTLKITGD